MNPLIELADYGIVGAHLFEESQFKLLFHYRDEEYFAFSSYCLFCALYHIIMGITPSKTKLTELNPTHSLYRYHQDEHGTHDETTYRARWRQMHRSISDAESRFCMESKTHPLNPKDNAAIRKGILTSTIQKQMLDRMETTGLTSAKKLESLGNSNYTNADKFKETFHSYDESIKELGISSPQCPPTRSSDQLL